MKSEKRAPEIAEINDLLHDLRDVLVAVQRNFPGEKRIEKRDGPVDAVRVKDNPRKWIPVQEMIDRLQVTLKEQRRFYPF